MSLRSLLLILLSAGSAWGDGGTVRISEPCGPYRVTVFTAPVPLRVGPIDVSVMVQDEPTRRIADVEVVVQITRTGQSLTRVATTEAATNKLLKAALFEVDQAGEWDVAVKISAHGTLQFPIIVAEPLPGLPALAGWIGWPAGAVGLYILHRFLVRRKQRSWR